MEGTKPIVTFDLDGVLCHPFLGLNPGGLKDEPVTSPGRWNPAWALERWRYYGRGPMPGAREGFQAISEFAECVVVTGRGEAARKHTKGWLKKNLGADPRLLMRPHWRERPPQFKQRILEELGPAAHFEDDPNTALRLAAHRPVYVVAWGRNKGFAADNVQRIDSVQDAVDDLRSRILGNEPIRS
jgi:hypothetical protein